MRKDKRHSHAQQAHQTGEIRLAKGDALLIVDVQNDFLLGGSLAVPDGDGVITVLNSCIDKFIKYLLPIFATRDWHPVNHCSFIPQGGPWPQHCIAGTIGAEFAGDLHIPATAPIISKGSDAGQDGYSGFADPALKDQLDKAGICRLFVGGLATDYCILNTVRDALNRRYQVMLLTDAVRAVNVRRRDGEKAIDEMLRKGAVPVTSAMIR